MSVNTYETMRVITHKTALCNDMYSTSRSAYQTIIMKEPFRPSHIILCIYSVTHPINFTAFREVGQGGLQLSLGKHHARLIVKEITNIRQASTEFRVLLCGFATGARRSRWMELHGPVCRYDRTNRRETSQISTMP
jgi:hypothetical protein